MTLSRSNARMERFREDMKAAKHGRVFTSLKQEKRNRHVYVKHSFLCPLLSINLKKKRISLIDDDNFFSPAREERQEWPSEGKSIQTCERHCQSCSKVCSRYYYSSFMASLYLTTDPIAPS